MPGVGETITWARALLALGSRERPRRDARRRPQGARGHRARARATGCSWCLRLASAPAAGPRGRRCGALGVRVGVGELLAAHRALAAVDAGSREQALLRAARHALLARARTTSGSRRLRGRVRRAERPEARTRSRRSGRRRAALPRVGVPPEAPAGRSTRPPSAGPGRLERRGGAAHKDFADLHGRRAPGRVALLARLARARADAAEPPHPRRRAARGDRPDLRATRARRCATAASRSSAAGARPRCARAGSCWSCDVSGSMAPYARMLLQYVQASVAGARGSRRSRSARGSRGSRSSCAGRDPDRAFERAAERVTDWTAARGSGPRSRRSTASTGGGSGAARVIVLLSTAGTAASPSELAAELAGSAARRTGWCG